MEAGLSGRQVRVAFARLSLAAGDAVAREELTAAVWPHQRPRDAPAILRTLLSRIRRALGPKAVTGRSGVQLTLPDPVTVDVQVAHRGAARGRDALDERDFLTAYRCAGEALEVLRQEFLPGETGGWVEQTRRGLVELRLDALECQALAGSHLGGAARAEAVRAGRELTERAPFRETGYAALMQAHAANGNVAEAIRVYVSLRDLLRRELGTVPTDSIVGSYERLLAGESGQVGEPDSYEGSPTLLRRALDAMGHTEAADPSLRCELLLELGASQEREGDSEAARATFMEAAATARELGRGDLLGLAALGYGGRGIPFAPGVTDQPLAALLEEALAALGEAQTPLRVQLLARLAPVLSGPTDLRRRSALAEEAVELARRLGEPAGLAAAVSARHLATWGPDNLEERHADALEIIRLASAGAGTAAALPGHLWLFTDRLEAGDLEGADRELAAYARLAKQLGHPGYLWWEVLLRGMRHFMAGRFADAERCAERVLGLAPRTQDALVAQVVGVQVLAVRKEAGLLPELETVVLDTIERHPDVIGWRCFLAYLYAEAGRLEEARGEFDPLLAELDTLVRDHLWLISIALLADVCAVLDDADAAAVLYRTLLPYGGRIVVGLGGLWFGPVEHHLALLARTRRQFDVADGHFEAAVETAQEMGARPWLGHILREQAAGLAIRHAPGDCDRANALLDQAVTIADELEMPDLHQAVDRIRAMVAEARA